MRCFLLTLAFASGCFATSLGERFYLTKTVYTFSDSTVDPVTVHVDDKVMQWLNGILLLGRKEGLEQAACLRVERASNDGRELWVDSVLKAYVESALTTRYQIWYECQPDQVPIHWHVLMDDMYQCVPSAYDTAPAWSNYRALLLQCGSGVDSLVTWRAKPRTARR